MNQKKKVIGVNLVFMGLNPVQARLDKDSAALAAGYDVVCLFVNDDASEPVSPVQPSANICKMRMPTGAGA
jgi:hypothetical protein